MQSGKLWKRRIFPALFLIFCLCPLLLMPLFGHQDAESEEASAAPPRLLVTDPDTGRTSLNLDFFSEAGDYFSYNFAFRQNLVTLGAELRSALFHTSAQDNVVEGRDGWLFYGSSMDDYLGRETMSDLQIAEAAYNLQLTQDTLKADGISFVFAIAPNKNSLYPQYMPTCFLPQTEMRNSTRLRKKLAGSSVNFVDLFDLFEQENRVLYHRTESHWTNEGAALVCRALLNAVGRESTDYSKISGNYRQDFQGDLFRMLYPTSPRREEEYYYDKERTYTYDEEIDSTYDPMINTTNPAKDGSVVMFRDSFGNSLLPFVADEFGRGYFSRLVPWDVSAALGDEPADVVIAELVERNLSELQEKAPILPAVDVASDVDIPEEECADGGETMAAEEDEDSGYLKITGLMDPERTQENTKTWICFYSPEEELHYLYPAYHVSEGAGEENPAELGYAAYVDTSDMVSGDYELSLVTENGGEMVRSRHLTDYTVQ